MGISLTGKMPDSDSGECRFNPCIPSYAFVVNRTDTTATNRE